MTKSLLKNVKHGLALFALVSIAITSCKKDKPVEIENATEGAYVLAEGAFNSPASTIDYFDINSKTLHKNYFQTINGYALGTNATTLKRYGNKMYCAVTGTDGGKDSFLEVIDVATGKSLKRIPFFDGDKSFHPRSIVFNENKAYITCYDGNVRSVDTASLSIDGRLKVGGVLEGAAITNGKLYVANTAHFNFPSNVKNAVSVVNLSTFTKIKDITVNYSPTQISVAPGGDLFVQTAGDYNTIMPSLDRISSDSDTKIESYALDIAVLSVWQSGSLAGVFGPEPVKTIDLNNGVLGASFIKKDEGIKTAYGISVDELQGWVYVSDALDYGNEGVVYAFDQDGNKQFSFSTSGLPKHIVFKYNR